MPKTILITGATGKQGTALIQKLSAFPTEFEIVGVTRNVDSAKSKRLTAQYPTLSLINSSLDKPETIFESVSSEIWGVFCILPAVISGFNPALEESQGKALIDTCLAHGVSHFVYSSVDRHGETESDNNETYVPHFQSKAHIEQHLQQLATEGKCGSNAAAEKVLQLGFPGPRHGMTYTILRLPLFMENFTDDFTGRLAATAWKVGLDPGRKLQMISAIDIAHYAHQSFLNSSTSEYRNRALSLAGDELTYAEANETFRNRFGRDLPTTYDVVGRFAFWAAKELEVMVRWWNEIGCAANIEMLRRGHPDMVRFKDWLEKSDFARW